MTDTSQIKEAFVNKELFDHALTHRSWLNEHKGIRTSNERLEFLGDAILEFVVSQEIFKQFPDKEEGYLTSLRANLVNTVSLADLAIKLNLGEIIYLSKGEIESGGRSNVSILADTVEAIIGAIFIDRGLEAAAQFVTLNIMDNLELKAKMPLKDAKSSLQEYAQSKGLDTPRYRVVSQTGPDHNRLFTIEAVVGGTTWGSGKGKSKSAAEQSAATDALSTRPE